MSRLSGKFAVVTGAAAGLGKAISLRFAAEGADVVACDIRPCLYTENDGHGLPGRITPFQADVTNGEDVAALLTFARGRAERIDVLVNNAGRFGGTPLLDTSDEDWNASIALNLTSVFLMCRTFVAAMRDQALVDGVRGRIINMGSQLGITAPPAAPAYAAAKAGVIHLTRQIAVDYAAHGIIANAIAPGRIITGDHPGESAYLEHGTIDEATRFSLARTPFSRLGRPDDVAGAALYLASDDCTFVSGTTLSVDGGWTAY